MRGRKPELKVIEEATAWEPTPPPHIPAEMAKEWQTIVDDLRDRQLLTPSMIGSVDTYVMALWTQRQAQKAIAEHGVLVTGAEGAMKNNPASNLLWRSQAVVARLAAEMGLTPASRSKAAFQKKEEEDDLFSFLDI